MGQNRRRKRSAAREGRATRVLLTTEGTYPHAVGGVSSWCDLLVTGLPEVRWQILPIIAAGPRAAAAFTLPANARCAGPIELWSPQLPRTVSRRTRLPRDSRPELPQVLVRELIGWNGNVESLTDTLVWCRRHPCAIRGVFRSAAGWDAFLEGLQQVLDERTSESAPPPTLDVVEAARLYQTLYWVARTAAAPTPDTDLLHVTAAGWAAVPALVHHALHGTPILLTEHGVYVREAYLAAVRSGASAGSRFLATRLARGLARSAYRAADIVSPVTDANARWEEGLGIDPTKIRIIYNGVDIPGNPISPVGNSTVVSVGRIDPLKDIHTMLRVAAEVVRRVPNARFLHYGPVTEGQDVYYQSCIALHDQLGLGDRFCFMGRTGDPHGVVRNADVVFMTSISEGLPLSLLEAMTQARPVVATSVGGVPDVVRGCGFVAPPGDVHGLALAISMLLSQPDLAAKLGSRGYDRVGRRFTQDACVRGYRELIGELGLAAA